MTRHGILFLAGVALATPPSLFAQAYPTTPPVAGPVRPMPFPPFRESTLPNGVRLVLVESHKQPVVSISLSFPAGNTADPEGREGLSQMVAGLLTKGAGSRDAEAISAAIEGVGGTLAASANDDFLTISASVLAPRASLAFELLADAVIRPTFLESEVELLRTQTLSGLQLEQSQPAAIAARFMASELYGSHPYARRPTPASTRAITRAEIIAFQQARLRPQGALLVIAGALTEAEATRLATAAFAGWTGAPPAPGTFPSPPPRAGTGILLVHRPGSVQADIRVGNVSLPATHPQQYAAVIANQVLGGGSDSRLFLILREQKSWTYGAYSAITRARGPGAFMATAEVRTDVADSALREMLAQIRRVTTEPIPEEEFRAVQGTLVGRFPLTVETVEQVAGQVAAAKRLGLADDYLATYRTRLAAVTPEQARQAAQAAMRPDAAAVVVVGDAAKLHDRLAAIAPVRLVSVDGTALAAEQLAAPAAAPATLDLAALVATRDSFAIMVQGNAFGFQVSELARGAEGWTLVEQTVLPALGLQQRTEVHLDPSGTLRSVSQRGQMQGRETSIDVTVANGRATGRATTPAPPSGEMKTTDIDAALPAGALDDNLLTAVAGAFRWAPGASFTVPVFGSGSGEVRQVTVRVAGTESVTVPAGTFEAYRVEVEGGPAPVTLFVTTAAPHHVVKIAPTGQPVEFVLVTRTPR